MEKQQAFGTWDSPISAEMVTTAGVRLGGVAYAAGAAFWSEARPQDEGRSVVVKQLPGQSPVDVIGAPFNVRTRVHEYGGGSWWVDEQHLYFVNWSDQRLYRVAHGTESKHEPEALTPEPSDPQSLRYADGCSSVDSSVLVCVRERHDASSYVHNELVVIPNTKVSETTSANICVIASGADFYSTPRFSPDGRFLSWIQWSHPQMPWDGTELVLASVESDWSLSNVRTIAGAIDTAAMGPAWSRTGRLIFASDESGWWNVSSYDPDISQRKTLTYFTDREVGSPAWVFGTQRFVELVDGNKVLGLALLVTHQARDQLQVLNTKGDLSTVDTPFTTINSIAATESGSVLLNAQGEKTDACVVQIDCRSGESRLSITELKPAAETNIDNAWLSSPEAISFTSGDRQAHAFFYPPAGLKLGGTPGELPPLIVIGHGGPTSHATAGLKLSIQYWTSRGIAVVDVNYGGSSGFGRDYRRLLNGQWGIVDVQDCIAATEYLAATGRVDEKRMVIRGGSAGGLTVLRALQISERFAGGTSLYGVTDLEMLAGDTHKFESRYLDGLLGGTYPEHKAIYIERSPIHHAEQLSCPILVLQGDEDKVVPPNQSAAIVAAAAKKGLPHAYILFSGEQHGFRQSENIIRALQLELWFYGSVLNFTPANDIAAPDEATGFT